MRLASSIVLAACMFAGAGRAAADVPEFIPHRAVYDLAIDRLAPKSSVLNAPGRLVYEFQGSTCAGWTTVLRQVVRIELENGQQTINDTRSKTWESANGQAFRFDNENAIDEASRTRSEGHADRDADGTVVADVVKPTPAKVSLGSGIVFPTDHMRLLLDTARAGRRVVTIKVFDGTETGTRVYDTTGVVGRPIEGGLDALEPAVRRPELTGVRRWPITVSYFDAQSNAQTPIYTLSFELFENGVSRDIVLDYGEFRLKSQLVSLEFAAPKPCN